MNLLILIELYKYKYRGKFVADFVSNIDGTVERGFFMEIMSKLNVTGKRITLFLNKLNDIQFIILMTMFSKLLMLSMGLLVCVYEECIGKINIPSQLGPNTEYIEILYVIFLGPFIESLVIIIIMKILGLKIKKESIVIIITAMIFGYLHGYNLFFELTMAMPGLVYCYSYKYYKPKHHSPFFIMTCIHSLFNFLAVIATYTL